MVPFHGDQGMGLGQIDVAVAFGVIEQIVGGAAQPVPVAALEPVVKGPVPDVPRLEVMILYVGHLGEHAAHLRQIPGGQDGNGQPCAKGLDHDPGGVQFLKVSHGQLGHTDPPVGLRVDQPFTLEHPEGFPQRGPGNTQPGRELNLRDGGI